MQQFLKTLSIFSIAISLLLSNFNFSFNLNIEAKNNETTTTKKNLKKKLSLNYTADRFETELNADQKKAILKSLKKWKGELPSLLSLDKFSPINA